MLRLATQHVHKTRSLVRLTTQMRSLRRLPRFEYPPQEGVAPVFSPLSGKYMFDTIHRRAVTHYNEMIEGTIDEGKPLEEVIVLYVRSNDPTLIPIGNAACQLWNWTVAWISIFPGGKAASPWLHNYFDVTFGGIEKFRRLWKTSCMSLFGSGWVWLVDNHGYLEIVVSRGSGNPVGFEEIHPLLVINLWEHAYFHDFGHNREAYVDAWLDAVNWPMVETRLQTIERSTRIEIHPEYKLAHENGVLYEDPNERPGQPENYK